MKTAFSEFQKDPCVYVYSYISAKI